jgi:hypothetical protein
VRSLEPYDIHLDIMKIGDLVDRLRPNWKLETHKSMIRQMLRQLALDLEV